MPCTMAAGMAILFFNQLCVTGSIVLFCGRAALFLSCLALVATIG